jgi:diguanylate cyclase (GGDEF)-like protein
MPLLVIFLGVAAIGTIVVLQQRANDGRVAELRLSGMKIELATLENVPFRATAGTGGSPAIASRLLKTGEGRITATLRDLQRNDPPPALERLQAPLSANFATLQRIYRVGVSTGTYGPEADRLSGIAAVSQAASAALLDEAGRDYGTRAVRSDDQATIGAALAIVLLLCAFGFLYRQNRRLLVSSQKEALSDALTGLRNRRAFVSDLEHRLGHASADQPLLLGLFDLDGFKQYNDTFGHPAGDALLARVGERLQAMLQGTATAYRIGGDEFCLLAVGDRLTRDELVARAAAALSESGDTFRISCSHGTALVPDEASSPEEALHLADQRMYARKAGIASAGRQSSDVLLKVLSERSRSLDAHVSSVGRLARLLARRLELPRHELDRIQLAAELHDIGKTAIPDSLLNKPGELSSDEWEYVRSHTLIGERILLAAPSLAQTAELVRSSHERIDGHGYPDGLGGDAIPIGSRIIAVCDAFDAMISDRSYRKAIPVAAALAELRLNAGTQFDSSIVDVFTAAAGEFGLAEYSRAA